MIDRASAIQLSGLHFPAGPEHVAQKLGVVIEYENIDPIEGWCIQYGTSAIICINSRSPSTRQRFTLAHELSHLVLGTPPGVLVQHFSSDSAEERQADALAGELLLPLDRVSSILGGRLPIDMTSLQKLARAADVSDLCAACRITNLAAELGLANAAVIRFDNQGQYQWRYAKGLDFTTGVAKSLHDEISPTSGTIRRRQANGSVVVASAIQTPYGSTMFVQVLDEAEAIQPTLSERRATLRDTLFSHDDSFEKSTASKMGHARTRLKSHRLDEACSLFYAEILPKWPPRHQAALLTDEGREYVRMELSKSCQP